MAARSVWVEGGQVPMSKMLSWTHAYTKKKFFFHSTDLHDWCISDAALLLLFCRGQKPHYETMTSKRQSLYLYYYCIGRTR